MNKQRGLRLLFVLFWLAFSLNPSSSSSEAAGAADEPAPGFEDPPVIYKQVERLVSSDPYFFEEFGSAVAISENTIVIGDFSDNNGPGTGYGAAYVFERASETPDSWVQTIKLIASDGESGDSFGASIAISGDTILIGAPGDDDLVGESGAAYIFERDAGGSGNWGEVLKLKSGNPQLYGNFGNSVAINGDTIVVAAHGEHGPGFVQGAAYVFERDEGGPGNWGEAADLLSSDHEDLDYFGDAVAIDGSLIVVGCRQEDGGPGSPLPDAGAAYVFERDLGGPGAWGEAAKLMAGDAQAGDEFGNSVSVSGETVVVGAGKEDGGPGDPFPGVGAVYIYEQGGGWGQTAKIMLAEPVAGDWFGAWVDIDGDLLAVSARNESVGPGFWLAAGVGHVFERNRGEPGSWGEADSFHADDAKQGSYFGFSIAIDGDYVVVGDPEYDFPDPYLHGLGAAYIFHRQTNIAFLPSVNTCSLYYLDDFSNANSGWPVSNSETAKFAYNQGEYQILLKEPFRFGGAYPGVKFDDYLLTADVRNVNDREGLYGLLFSQLNSSNFYAYFIDNNGHYQIWMVYVNNWYLLKEGVSPYLNKGSTLNRIGILEKENMIYVLANGELLTSLNDSLYDGKMRIGVLAISGPEENLDVRFDNFKVEPVVCGWGADPVAFPGAESFTNPRESGEAGWLDVDLPEGLFTEP